jgi:deoxyhypusine synthase
MVKGKKAHSSKVPVVDMRLEPGMTVGELVRQYDSACGFTSKAIAESVDVLEDMILEKGCVKFLSFPACINATGLRGVIRELIKRKLFDAVITTCGTLDHDLARTWRHYYHGSFEMDDKVLHRKGVNRLGNVLVPNDSYGIILEKRLQPLIQKLYDSGNKGPSTREFVQFLGDNIDDDSSLLHWAAKNKTPVFVPGITDGSVGSQVWTFRQAHRDFTVDVFKDEDELAGMVFGKKKSGALIIGGGISKHHTIWWNQFKDGLDYAVYLTTALEYDGSLSGARVKEAISWGKVKERARIVNIDGEATAILPLMIAALLDRIS